MVAFSKFISSQRGGKLLVDTDGFIYSKRKQLKAYTVYDCRRNSRTKSVVDKCPGKVLFYDEENLTLTHEHNHEAIVGSASALEIKTGIKRKAEGQRLTPTQTIITETLASCPPVDHLLSKMSSLQRLVERSRKIPEPSPCTKKSHRAGYIIPDSCKITVDGKRFLLYDEPGCDDRIIVFATDRSLDVVKDCNVLLCDGTFDITPAPFYQMYSFHASNTAHHGVSVIYSLLPDKTKKCYLKLANVIKEYCGELEGIRILLDFEVGAVNAFKETFPLAIIKLCFFHFAKNIYKNTCKHFKSNYLTDPHFAKTTRLLACLAFVPLDFLEYAIDEIMMIIAVNYPT